MWTIALKSKLSNGDACCSPKAEIVPKVPRFSSPKAAKVAKTPRTSRRVRLGENLVTLYNRRFCSTLSKTDEAYDFTHANQSANRFA